MASRRYAAKRRSTSRRTYRKKRAYPTRRTTRKRTYRKKTSRKSLADRMSHKKRDIMVSAAGPGLNPSPGTQVVVNQNLVINITTNNSAADGIHMTGYIPSARSLSPNNYAYSAIRTATRTYVKGISEMYHFVPSDASAWEWRRIVVAQKYLFGQSRTAMTDIAAQFGTGTTYRYFKDLTGDASGSYTAIWDAVQDVLFAGVKTVDWQDPMTAPVDRARVTLLSDKRRMITSNNDAPRPRMVKTYVPINKTIQYDDEENGVLISPTRFSVDNNIGLGDIFVFDMFTVRAPVNAVSSQLQIRSTMTYYWHEK